MSRTYDALQKAEAERAHSKRAPLGPPDPFITPRAGTHSAPRISLDLDASIEEEYQKLRSNLFARPGKEGLRTLMIAGANHGEGVTTTCVILASVLARAGLGEIVLVDANLRTPALHELFPPTGVIKGLTDLLANGTCAKDLIQPTPVPNLSVIAAGRSLRSPSQLYQERIGDLLAELQKQFRYILLDCPPVKDYSDSTFLAPKVDGILLVIRAEQTKIEVAVKAKRELEWAGGQVIGAVFNSKRTYIPLVLERLL
jgi:capsular exopolysaccharide synthesis family protein